MADVKDPTTQTEAQPRPKKTFRKVKMIYAKRFFGIPYGRVVR